MIDLTPLINYSRDTIILDDEKELDLDEYHNNEIKELSRLKVTGKITREEDDIMINLSCKGEMLIEDSISLDDVWYPFSFNIDENIEEFIQKDEKILDINEVLWQNVVLEIPLRYTLVDNYDRYYGDGWKLVSEEELNINNPFVALQNTKDRSDNNGSSF